MYKKRHHSCYIYGYIYNIYPKDMLLPHIISCIKDAPKYDKRESLYLIHRVHLGYALE